MNKSIASEKTLHSTIKEKLKINEDDFQNFLHVLMLLSYLQTEKKVTKEEEELKKKYKKRIRISKSSTIFKYCGFR